MADNYCPDYAVAAQYTESRIPQFQGNPLIEALPPALGFDDQLRWLFSAPSFDPEQMNWANHERLHLIGQLSSFMAPLDRHVELAQNLDSLIRQGYVGRAPRTQASQQRLAKLYQQQKAGQTFASSEVQFAAQLSGSLIGVPGVGKTTTIRRLLARFPQVIYHPNIGVYQVPYLHIETPYDGASVKGLAESIFRKMDKLIPDARYGKLYGSQRAGAEALMNHAARILHTHAVGLLVVDEIQNLSNSPKNSQALMTLLVSASTELGVPILFVGTNKAQQLLTQDFRQARRSSGSASAYWGPLVRGDADSPEEWEDFLSLMWRFQWVKHPLALSKQISDLLYHHSQGITDIAIKLFAIAQARAIYDGSETVTAALIDAVAQKELAAVMPMIEALRRDDLQSLEAYRDLAPVGLDALLSGVRSNFSGRRVRGLAIGGELPLFKETVTEVLTSVGFEATDAQALADDASDAPNLLKGIEKALKQATSGKPAPKLRNKGVHQAEPANYLPGDYRNATNPEVAGNSVVERMKQLQMLPDLELLFAF